MADVVVSLGVVLSELKDGLAQGSSMFDNFTKKTKQGREGLMFFSNAIRDISGSTTVAGTALSGLLSAFTMGGGMGIAIGAVNTLIGTFKTLGEAEKKATEEIKKYAEEARKAQTEVAALNAERKGDKVGATQIRGDDKAKAAAEEVSAAYKNMVKVNTDASKNIFGVSDAEMQAASDRYTTALDKLRQVTIENQKAITDAETEHAAKVAAQVDKEQTLREEAAKKAADLQKAIRDAKNAAEDKAFQDDLDLQKAIEDAKNAAADRQFEKEMELEQAIEDAKIAAENKAFEEQYERDQAALQARAQTFAAWGETIGASIANSLNQGMSPLKTAANLLKDVIKNVLKAAITQITANAGVAASGAASSQASVPIVGPALAVGAMSAMMALVMGLIDGLPSAAGGWDIPKGVNPIVQTHSGEMILPERLADRVRNATEPASAPMVVNNNVSAFDAKSVDALFRDSSSAINKSMRHYARRRRKA